MSHFLKFFVIFLTFLSFNLYSFSNTTVEFDFPEETTLSELSNYTKGGKYGISHTFNNGSNDENQFIIIWNYRTGKSKMYYSTKEANKLFAASLAINLPQKPLGASYAVKGDYKITFFTDGYYTSKWTILVWDSKNCYSKWYAGSLKLGKIVCKNSSSVSAIPINPIGKIDNADYDIQISYVNRHYINIIENNTGKGKIYANEITDQDEPSFSLDKSFSISANIPAELGSKGRFGASYAYSGKQRYSIMWNRQTGASKMYYGVNSQPKFSSVASQFRIPVEPLGKGYKVAGEYKMSYIADNWNKTQWMVLVWDTGNGNSALYYGNISINKTFKVSNSSYRLPAKPLGAIQNAKFNMRLHSDMQRWYISVWDENSGTSKLFRSFIASGDDPDFWSQVKGIKPDEGSYILPVSPVK